MIALIPARGGSKGLPGKNIKALNGKPLIAYTIEAALASDKISRVLVSTDDPQIAEISKRFGAEVPFLRPRYLAEDNSKAIDVYNYTIEKLAEDECKSIEEIAILQPTSPLRNAMDIGSAIDLFRNKKADSVVSYCKEEHPIFWHKYVDKNLRIKSVFQEEVWNRQESKRTYYPNGAIFIFRTNILQTGKYYSNRSYAYIMPGNRSVDIDTLDDFQYVEFLLKFKN